MIKTTKKIFDEVTLQRRLSNPDEGAVHIVYAAMEAYHAQFEQGTFKSGFECTLGQTALTMFTREQMEANAIAFKEWLDVHAYELNLREGKNNSNKELYFYFMQSLNDKNKI